VKLQPGAVRGHLKKGVSQSHPGVSPLDPLNHRTIGYQPLPKPLGLPPYHYALTDYFRPIAKQISSSGKMVLDARGDSGGVQDAEFQSNVADQMVHALAVNQPQFC
jgi:acid phosphatase type 7